MDIENPAALLAYLRETGRIAEDETPEVCVLRGGVSNRTVLVTRPSGEQWVLKQALAKLRVQVEWLSPPERITREALGMRWLAQLLPAGTVPQLVFEDPAHYLLAMSAVPAPHRNWKTMLLEGDLQTDHIDQFAHLLAAMHHGSRTPEAAEAFDDRSYFESLRLEPYYEYTAAQVPAAAPFLRALIDETRATRLSIVHGDFSPKNILVHHGRLILLDHEVIHYGDPAFDLGFSLTHLLSKANHLFHARPRFLQAALRYWNQYAAPDPAWAAGIEARAVRHTLACMLARVDGRSPLEYLTESQRHAQRAFVLRLLAIPPSTVHHLLNAIT
jgi:5-methylthioribose kinase